MKKEPADTGKPMCCAPGQLTASTISTKGKNMTEQDGGIPEGKRTALGLYLTAREAYARWQAAPDEIKIIDTRTPEEYLFVGSPTMAWRIPVAAQSYEWDGEKQMFPLVPLFDFAERVQSIAKPDDTIMVMCRSGGRSAIAANMLAKAGFTDVHNIIDGMEGDANGDSEVVAQNQPLKDGWKNSGCPWTKAISTDQLVLPMAD